MKPKPPSGRTIVTELLKEMEERLYPLLYRTLPPSVYHVYLHPDDYREIEAIVPLIVADAEQGLNARVDELNGGSRWASLVNGRQAPIEVPPGGWEIHIHAEPNGELTPGELGLESRLSVPPPPRYEGGTPTTRIARTVVTGTIRRAAAAVTASAPPAPSAPIRDVPEPTRPRILTPDVAPPPLLTTQPPAAVPVPSAIPMPHPGSDVTATAARPADRQDGAAAITARLAYVDEDGPHVFVMRKDLISIGRGGSAHWVDVQVVTTPRVSREHCRIRKSADGRFLLQDVSSWGTSIDGRVVTPFARQAEGTIEQLGDEHELPARARIGLADAVVIDFVIES